MAYMVEKDIEMYGSVLLATVVQPFAVALIKNSGLPLLSGLFIKVSTNY